MSRRVFISYNAADSELVAPVTTWLRTSDLSPAEIADPVGSMSAAQDVRSVIQDSIATCDAMVVIWSKRAAESKWVHYELGMAQALGKRIVVVLAGGSPSELPQELADTQHVHLNARSA
ncbi:toll/interleukin-1 receptor domain-containing protein [bacterium]|nr:toll/interleukin-1 receptor domain-containing protein [bacterium]